MNKSLQDRFEDKFVRVPFSECWYWTASASERSSPQTNFQIGNKRHIASRVAYTLYKGEIPSGKIVRHTCDNGFCVNPEHLILGTQFDNMQDRKNRGRWKGGRPMGSKNKPKIC
jgi:hypothetical protein